MVWMRGLRVYEDWTAEMMSRMSVRIISAIRKCKRRVRARWQPMRVCWARIMR